MPHTLHPDVPVPSCILAHPVGPHQTLPCLTDTPIDDAGEPHCCDSDSADQSDQCQPTPCTMFMNPPMSSHSVLEWTSCGSVDNNFAGKPISMPHLTTTDPPHCSLHHVPASSHNLPQPLVLA